MASKGDHPDKQVGSRDKDVGWYLKNIENVSDSTRALLENYSKIPSDQVVSHCLKIRDQAWDVFPYPCIGQFRFLDLSIGLHPLYQEILSRMKTGKQKYLDLGCCFGQDIRRLVADGVPSENCYGSDLRLDFMQIGYKLFLDEDALKTEFIAGDVFDPESNLKKLEGNMDVIHAAAFFHLFGWDEQKAIARRVLKLLKPQKDSLLVGRQVGNVKGGEFPHRTNPSRSMFRHDNETWKQMWTEIGTEMNVQLSVESQLLDWPSTVTTGVESTWLQSEGARRLVFSVRRL